MITADDFLSALRRLPNRAGTITDVFDAIEDRDAARCTITHDLVGIAQSLRAAGRISVRYDHKLLADVLTPV